MVGSVALIHRQFMSSDAQINDPQGFPPRPQPAWSTYCLLAILALAWGLRIWGITFGLPYDFDYDEGKEVHRALKLGVGEYYWGFGKGGLYYLLFVEYAVLYVVWWIMGVVSNTHDFALSIIQDQTVVFLLGRLTVSLMGTLTCLVIFWLGRRVYDWRVGLGAALIGATAYAHGMYSHTIMVDIGMTLALWASILAYLEYEKKQERRWLLGAGALGGLAIAFKLPGAIVLPSLFVAIASRAGRGRDLRQLVKEAGLVLLALLVTLTVVAPEWTMSIGSLHRSFSRVLGIEATSTISSEADLQDDIVDLTTYHGKKWAGYFYILLKEYNIVLTCSALLGAVLGLWRRHRWDMIWSGVSIVFLGIMTAADRSTPEHYLLPIMPAFWLLSSRAVIAVFGHRLWLTAAGFACVIVLPLYALVYQNYMWTKPDTRVLAKAWIEANVPSGAKILMDGMQYRFVMSPPLTPNRSVVARQVAKATEVGPQLSRGVSHYALTLYAEAMAQIEGPTYELHSTVWGLGVEDLTFYTQACFDYIVTSSMITNRYVRDIDRQRFPKSAQFYEQLKTDPRFRVIYSITSVPWKIEGPTITVYKVLSPCQTSSVR